jgi:hypothetical protein
LPVFSNRAIDLKLTDEETDDLEAPYRPHAVKAINN